MNHSFIRWTAVCWFAFAGTLSNAQEMRSGPNRFGLSFNVGLNIPTDFTRTGADARCPRNLDLSDGGHTCPEGYAIRYSNDMVTWRTAVSALTAPATRVQWIDSGPSKTDSSSAQQCAILSRGSAPRQLTPSRFIL